MTRSAGCELKNEHSQLDNKHETDHLFVSSIINIQNGEESKLPSPEKITYKPLLKRNHPKMLAEVTALSAKTREVLSTESET